MKKNEKKLILLGILFLLLIVIAVLIVSSFYRTKNKSQNQAESMNEQLLEINEEHTTNVINDANEINVNTNNTVVTNTTATPNTTIQNTITNSNTSSNTTNSTVQESTNNNNDIIGKWNTTIIQDMQTGEEYDNFRDFFGSSYLEFGSYLQLNSNGTFVDAINPVTDGSKSSTGTYKVIRNYNTPGDCYVELTYSDGRIETLQKIYYDETGIPYLAFSSENVSYSLKK